MNWHLTISKQRRGSRCLYIGSFLLFSCSLIEGFLIRAVGYRCELGNDQDELQLCSAAIRLGQYPLGLYRSAIFYDVSIATAVPAAIDHEVQSEKLINKSKHSCIKDICNKLYFNLDSNGPREVADSLLSTMRHQMSL